MANLESTNRALFTRGPSSILLVVGDSELAAFDRGRVHDLPILFAGWPAVLDASKERIVIRILEGTNHSIGDT